MFTKGIKKMLLISVFAMLFAAFYPRLPFIRNAIHSALDPTIGLLLDWNLSIGMLIVVAILSLLTSLIHKYTTDQHELRKLKEEQKILQAELKKYQNDPKKLVELQRKQIEFFPKTLDLTVNSALYTLLPFLLLFRWFIDYFSENTGEIFGFLSWFWAYFIFTIIFSSIWRKALNVA